MYRGPGYRPSVRSRFLDAGQVLFMCLEVQKHAKRKIRTMPISSVVARQVWSLIDEMVSRKPFACGKTAGNHEHLLARSVSQSLRRISFILRSSQCS